MPNVPIDDPYFSELRNIILPDAEKQPDRSFAIVFVAIVEDHLTQAIKAHLIDHKKICNGMFNGMGPLATFAAKIDLGFLLGLYREELTKALHALRRIRAASDSFIEVEKPRSYADFPAPIRLG